MRPRAASHHVAVRETCADATADDDVTEPGDVDTAAIRDGTCMRHVEWQNECELRHECEYRDKIWGMRGRVGEGEKGLALH